MALGADMPGLAAKRIKGVRDALEPAGTPGGRAEDPWSLMKRPLP
jgi:hypothetical protein